MLQFQPILSIILSIFLINGLINISYRFSSSYLKIIENKLLNFVITFFFLINFLSIVTFNLSIFFGVNRFLIITLSIIILLYGFYKPSYLKLFFLKIIHEKGKEKIIVYIFLFAYFLLSIGPLSDNDSLDYHLTVPLYSLSSGVFYFKNYWLTSQLSGAGEALAMYGISIGAFHLSQILQFVSLSFLVILILNFSENKFYQNQYKEVGTILIAILGIPIFVFLCTTSKFQLFSIVSNFVILLTILFFFKKLKSEKIYYPFFIIIFTLLSSIQFKFSFILSSSLIFSLFLFEIFKNNKKLLIKFILLTIFCFVLIIFPREYFEYLNFSKNIFYNFFNPVTDNFSADMMNRSLAHGTGNSRLFPIWIIMPLKNFKFIPGDITYSIGVAIFLIFLSIDLKRDTTKKIFILSFVFAAISLIFGQPTGRFFLEPVIWLLFISGFYLQNSHSGFQYFLKKGVLIISSIFMILIFFIGIKLSYASSSLKNYNNYLKSYSDGFALYSWANKIIPIGSNVISTHRSHFYSKNKIIPYDFRYYATTTRERNYYIKEIIKEKPSYILYTDYEYNNKLDVLKNCRGKLFVKKEEIGHITGRNPFNSKRKKYGGIIHKIHTSDLAKCIK